MPGTADELMTMFARINPSLDAVVREGYGELIEAAFRGKLEQWTATPRGLIALILVIDQFPRHAFRGTARQYEGDERGVELSLRALDAGWDREMHFLERTFLIMPLAHAENVELQQRCVVESDRNSAEAPESIGWFREIGPSQARKYLDVIERFGRFPHRNEMLGRASTAEELEFLETWAERQPPDALRARGLA